MTLIAARISGEKIAIVADTKITAPEGSVDARKRTLRVYEYPLLKLAIIRRDLALGVAGEDPVSALKQAGDSWAGSPEEFLRALERYTIDHNVGFVVATLNPAKLWWVADGTAYERTHRGDAWEGDPAANEELVQLYADWEKMDVDIDFRLMSSMQRMTSPFFARHDSVGGYAIHVATGPAGFEYVPSPSAEHTDSSAEERPFFILRYAAGRDETPGALGCFVEGSNSQVLFCHQKPWEPIRVQASTMNELVAAAAAYGQTLKAPDFVDPFGIMK